jgi:integrase/recombinase XerD
MPRRKGKWEIDESDDPQGMLAMAERLYLGLRAVHYSERTIESVRHRLRPFFFWCLQRSITRPNEVTRSLLERYQQWQFHYRKDNGEPLDFGTQKMKLGAVKLFFKWLAKNNLLLFNPASEIEYPKVGSRLPKVVLSHAEVEQVLALPNVQTVFGLRDRAMLETFYSTGARRAELIALTLTDLDVGRGVVFVRKGKGDKDRCVPIGERALAWIHRYIEEARPNLLKAAGERSLFLTWRGEPFGLSGISYLVSGYVKRANLGKTGSCHVFRHAMATEMLEGGADVRFIQEILGHSRLTTTAVYTKVSIAKLKQVHTATHPAATLLPRPKQHDGELDPTAQEQLEHLLQEKP